MSDLDGIADVDDAGRREAKQSSQLVKAAFIGMNWSERRHDPMLAVALQIIIEIIPADHPSGIEVGFDGQATGVDHFMRFDLDMEVLESLPASADSSNRIELPLTRCLTGSTRRR